MRGEMSSGLRRTLGCLLLAGAFGLGCGSSGGGGPSGGGGSYSWSVSVSDSKGVLSNCTNYVHTAKPPTNVMGGTVSNDPCPAADDVLGVCSGIDQGGNHFQQVFYNDTSLSGAALSAGVQNLMLSCSALSGTWSTTYDGSFGSPDAGGSGGSGGSGGGTGGSGGGNFCAQLLACCNATGSTNKTSCMAIYNGTSQSESACQIAYSGIMASYCP